MKKLIFALTAGSLAVVASSQSYSSFQTVTNLVGLNTSVSGLNFTTTVGPTPSFMLNSINYTITDVFGVWQRDGNPATLTATNGSGNPSGWTFDSNTAGAGRIFGYKTNPNTGMTPNSSLTFNFGTKTGTEEDIGYHVRISGQLPTGGNTLYITGNPVPEPATMAVLGLGAAALLRRKRK